jgi:hypothetical protein
VTLELRLNFQNATDEILLGSVGVKIQSKTERCVDSIADLRALRAGAFHCVELLGYYKPGDGGGGEFFWDALSTESDNRGTIILPASSPAEGRWKRLVEGPLSVKWFGAKGDGKADDSDERDTCAINAAIKVANAAVTATSAGVVVYLPPGTYKVIKQLRTLGPLVWLRGASRSSVIIQSFVTDTLLYLAEESNQTGKHNGVENIQFQCETDQSASTGWLAASGTATISVNASRGTFRRSAGSFVADGFQVGQRILPAGFSNAANKASKE